MNEKSNGYRSRKQRLTAVGTRCADHVTPLYTQKLALTSPTGGGRYVGIVRVRTKATEFSLVYVCFVMITQHTTSAKLHKQDSDHNGKLFCHVSINYFNTCLLTVLTRVY